MDRKRMWIGETKRGTGDRSPVPLFSSETAISGDVLARRDGSPSTLLGNALPPRDHLTREFPMSPDIKLTAEQAEMVRAALALFVVRDRTGELGIMHGADRFVSTNRSFRKKRFFVDLVAGR
jgi:hypothetical protein